MSHDDDNPFGVKPRLPPAVHVIGQALDELSLHELDERVLALTAEIDRLKETRRSKEASRTSAAAVFKM